MAQGGGLPPEPSSYAWLQTFAHSSYSNTTSATWTFTAPTDGWYLFHVIGKGGNGGKGGVHGRYNGQYYSGGGGGSGASGAYARHAVYMKAGETATITYSTSQTKLVVHGETVIANAGGNGSDGMQSRNNNNGIPGGGGSPSAAAGANRANISGKAGQSGSYGALGDDSYTGGKGASTSNPPYPTESKYMNGTYKTQGQTPSYAATGSGTILGNPGPGGEGAFTNADGSYNGGGGSGTAGAAGGVVVEKGAA